MVTMYALWKKKKDLIVSFALKINLELNREGIQKHLWGILVMGVADSGE